MNFLLDFAKMLCIITFILICFMVIFSIVEGTINYFRNKKIKKEFNQNLKTLLDEELPKIIEEIEKDEIEKKETKKATRKPRKAKKEEETKEE